MRLRSVIRELDTSTVERNRFLEGKVQKQSILIVDGTFVNMINFLFVRIHLDARGFTNETMPLPLLSGCESLCGNAVQFFSICGP